MYVPAPPPVDQKQLGAWLFGELRRLAEILNQQQERVRLAELNAAPAKPRDGDLVYADGTNFNPTGGGEGVYARVGGSWTKL